MFGLLDDNVKPIIISHDIIVDYDDIIQFVDVNNKNAEKT